MCLLEHVPCVLACMLLPMCAGRMHAACVFVWLREVPGALASLLASLGRRGVLLPGPPWCEAGPAPSFAMFGGGTWDDVYPPKCTSRTGDDAKTESVIVITGPLLCDGAVLSQFLGGRRVEESCFIGACSRLCPCRVSNAQCTGLGCIACIMCASVLQSQAVFVRSAACYAPRSSCCNWVPVGA